VTFSAAAEVDAPSLIRVNRVTAIAWVDIVDAEIALGGTDTINVVNTGDDSNVAAIVDAFQIAMNDLVNGRPAFHTGAEAPVQQSYFGGEPVVDPFTFLPLFYAGGEPMFDLFTGDPVLDAFGNQLTHKAKAPILHSFGDPVVHAHGAFQRYLGGELTFDEAGNLVFNPVRVTQNPTLVFADNGAQPDTITRLAGNWKLDQFQVGDRIHVTGSALNDTEGHTFYTIAAISADSRTITLSAADELVAETNNGIEVRQLFLHLPGQPLVHERGSRAYDLIDENGQIVEDGRLGAPYMPATFVNPSSAVLELANYDLRPGDLVGVVVYRGTEITSLMSGVGFTVNGENDVVILDPSINLANATFKVIIQTPSFHEESDAVVYNGTQFLEVGQPVVDAAGSLALDEAGEVLLHTEETIGRNISEAFSFTASPSQTFQLSQDFLGGYIAVKLAGAPLAASQFTFDALANTVTVTPGGAVVEGSQVIVTYRIAVKTHARGEQVYALEGGEFVAQVYMGDGTEARLHLGNEPMRYLGGETAFYTAADPVRELTEVHRLLINSTASEVDTDPGELLFRNVGVLEIELGGGNDQLAIVQTHLGASSDAPLDPVAVAVDLGEGDHLVAVRSIAAPATVTAYGGKDVFHIGSQAGLWVPSATTQAPAVSGFAKFVETATAGRRFLNVNGVLDHIDGVLTIHAGTGTDDISSTADLLDFDDSADGNDNDGTLGATRLSGLDMLGRVDYFDFEHHELVLGSGNDGLNVLSIAGPTNVETALGDDTVQVGSTTHQPNPVPGSTLNEIVSGRLILAGQGGHDELEVYDSGDTASSTDGRLTANEITGLGMTLGISYTDFERLELNLSRGADEFFVASTHPHPVHIHAGDGNDVVDIDIIAAGAPTTFELGEGDDVVRVNFDENGAQTFRNGVGDVLTLKGQFGSDTYEIGLAGAGSALVNVEDESGAVEDDAGIDDLVVYGTNDADFFLLRANLAGTRGMVAAIEVDENRQPLAGGAIERVNYDGDINGRFVIFGREGDDTFVLDDTLSPTVIFGDAGDDTFQIGQVFASPRDDRDPNNGLAPEDYFRTTATTRGFLSNGVSQNTTLFGGFGKDSFTVYRNTAELFLFGEEDDDSFRVRAFVRVNPNDPDAPFTNINGGQGADFISFTVNARVNIEGGDGFDTVTVVGTEFGDDFVVTSQGVFGAGLFVTYGGVEKVVVDGLEGNDRFFIRSTSESVALQVVGGMGSDTFNVGGGNDGNAITVVSNSLTGHSGLIVNTVSSADPAYQTALGQPIFVQDISTQVGDNDEPGAIVDLVDGALLVFEESANNWLFGPTDPRADLIGSSYRIVLTRSPTESVRVTAAAVPLREGELRAGARAIGMVAGAVTAQSVVSESGVSLLFDRNNWFIPQTITVFALPDTQAEGRRFINIQHTVIQGADPGDGGEYDGLIIRGVTVEVIDDEVAEVVVVETDGNTLVVEGEGGNPASDTYQVVLSRAPADGTTVLIDVAADGQLKPIATPLEFRWDNWFRPQTITIEAHDDELLESTHFSRVLHRLASGIDDFLNVRVENVAAGLAAAVNGDTVAGYRASSSGLSLVIEHDAAFTVDIHAPVGTALINGGSIFAFEDAITVQLGGDLVEGNVWVLGLNGVTFRYALEDGQDLGDVAAALGAEIEGTLGALYAVTATGGTLDIDRLDAAAFTATVTDGVITGASSATHYARVQIDLAAEGTLAKGDTWTLTLDDGSGPASEVDFVFAVGSRFSSLDLGDAAIGLAAAISADAGSGLAATTDGRTLTITGTDTVIVTVPFGGAAVVPGTGSVAITLSGGDLIAQGDRWTVTIGEKDYHFDAPALIGAAQFASVDVMIADDDQPGVLILESNGSTIVVEPSRNVVLGSGGVTDVVIEPFSVITLNAPGAPPAVFSVSTQNRNMVVSASPNPADFDHAEIALFNDANGTIAAGSVWTVVINGQTFTHTALAGNKLQHVATALRDKINAAFPGMASVVERTRFKGDFGVAVIREIEVHDSVFVAQDLDLAKWNDNPTPDILAVTFVGNPPQPQSWLPHLTVLATGDGTNDFYRFEITEAMLKADVEEDGLRATFDIDRGFDFGDAILWASRLTLHRGIFNDTTGDLISSTPIAFGPGFSDPFTPRNGGSTSWLDDYLTYTFTEKGVYFIEVGKWYPFGLGGLPEGVDYELQVSLEAHEVHGFVFAPEAVLETERQNDVLSVPGSQFIGAPANFFTFFDQTIGNTGLPGSSGTSGDINFLTPTVRVRGGGDGTYDVFSFTITQNMLDAQSVGIPVGDHVLDPSNDFFFTHLDLRLNGEVKAGDVWALGLRYRNYSYVAEAGDDLQDVANGLLAALDPRFSESSVMLTQGSTEVHLVIRDANGFNLRGLAVDGVPRDGLTQEVQSAGDVIRTSSALTQGGEAILFTSATIALQGPLAAGEMLTLTLGGTAYSAAAVAGDLAASALALKNAVTDASYTIHASGGALTVSRAAAFSVTFSLKGAAPTGSAVIAGTPIASQVAEIEWLQAAFSLSGPARPGETWTVTLDGNPYSYVAGANGDPVTLDAIASGLAAAIGSGYTTTASGTTLTVAKSGGFTTDNIAVTPAGSAVIDTATATTATVSLAGPVFDGDDWIITVDAVPYSYTANGADGLTAEKVAEKLAGLIDAAGGLTASHEGSTVVITKPAGGALLPTFRIEADGEATVSATATSRAVMLAGAVNDGDVWTLTFDTHSATFTASGSVLADVLADFAGEVDGTPGFSADIEGSQLIVTRLAGGSFALSVDVTAVDNTLITEPGSQLVTLETPVSDAWTITVDGTPFSGTAAQIAVAIDAVAGYSAIAVGSQVVVTKTGGGIAVIAFTSGTGSVTARASAVVNLNDPVSVGDAWSILFGGNTASHAATSTSVLALAAELASDVNGTTGFVADTEAGGLVVITRLEAGGFTTTFDIESASAGTVAATDPQTVTLALSGNVNGGDRWIVDVTGLLSAPHLVGALESLGDVATGLAGALDMLLGYSADVEGSVIVLTRFDGTAFEATYPQLRIQAAGSGAVDAATAGTTTAALTGPSNAFDDWVIALDGLPYAYTVQPGETPAMVALGLAALLDPLQDIAAAAEGATIAITRIDGAAFTVQFSVEADPNQATAVASATPALDWTQTVRLHSSGAGQFVVNAGDVWRVTVAGTRYEFVVVDAETTLSQVADGLAGMIGATATAAGDTIVIAAADGTALAVGPIKQVRAAPATIFGMDQPDGRPHYLQADFTLTASGQPWLPGETWTAVVDGTPYSFTVPLTGFAVSEQTLATIASRLAAAIDADPRYSAVATLTTIAIRDVASGVAGLVGDDPFTLTTSRERGEMRAVFDIDNANVVRGSVAAGTQLVFEDRLIGFFLGIPIFFPVPVLKTVLVDFTSSLTLELFSEHDLNTPLAVDRFNVNHPGNLVSGNHQDFGSTSNRDPFIEYVFRTAGTYLLRVGSFVDYAPNAFGLVDRLEPVRSQQSYDLLVSLERHETNPDVIELAGKTITIVSGPGEGQQAKILAYNAEAREYVLDQHFATALTSASRFDISFDPAAFFTDEDNRFTDYSPVVDTFDVVLTARPSADVIVSVLPSPTRTFNADLVFDPLANFGQANEVQVEVATPRALVQLGGTPSSQSWIVTLTSLDAHGRPDRTAARSFSDTGDIEAHTGYDVELGSDGTSFTIKSADGSAFFAELEVAAGQGAGSVTPQLLFTPDNWNVRQTVTVMARDDEFVDGSDALVFPAFEERVNEIRGPLEIEGGVLANEERFLNDPFRLPGESNLPLAEGSVGAVATNALGNAVLTDRNARHVNALTGERPGFDPRMNDFSFEFTFLQAPLQGVRLEVDQVSQDILSVARSDPFRVNLTRNGAAPGSTATFFGIPDQADLDAISWLQAVVSLQGSARVGETWTITLGDTAYSVTVEQGEDVLSRIARDLAAEILGGGEFDVELRISLLGTARLFISRLDGEAFDLEFAVTPAPTTSATDGGAEVSGTPVQSVLGSASIDWTQAAFLFHGPASGTWSLALDGQEYGPVAGTADVAALTGALAGAIADEFAPLVSGSTVSFKSGWPRDAAGAEILPTAGDDYSVAALNPNVRVDESVQVDTVNVFNGDSPSNDAGVLTERRLSGLGMGGDAVIGGQLIAGGIRYAGIEVLNIELGSGDDTLTIESTHAGATNVDTGGGNDIVHVRTIGGHTAVATSAGDDTVNVQSEQLIADQVAALLTIDAGAGMGDVVNFNDSGDPDDAVGVLTDTTLIGLDMPTVAESQTIFVQAASGTYTLTVAGFGAVTLDYAFSAAQVKARLGQLYGFTDIEVTETRTVEDVTYVVSFVRSQAGINFAQLEWDGDRSGLTPNPNASANVLTATLHDGRVAPILETQTLRVQAQGGTYQLRLDGFGAETGLHESAHILRETGYALLTLDFLADAATVKARLEALYGLSGIEVSEARTDGEVTYTIVFGGAAAGVNLPQPRWAETRATTFLVPGLGALADVQVATVTNGLRLNNQQTLTVEATDGFFTITLLGQTTAPIAWNATALDLFKALSPILNPNGASRDIDPAFDAATRNPSRPFTDNVAVAKHGNHFLITFRGAFEHLAVEAANIDTTELDGSVALALRVDGINYYGVDTLNMHIGSDDVVNVRGTPEGSTVNMDLDEGPVDGGNERIYISSDADFDFDDHVEFLTGHLDDIRGTLNINARGGRHLVMISDEAARAGDTNVLITDSYAAASAREPNVAANGEIFIIGLAPAGISFRADADGNFADGVTIWTGWGDDTITIDGTHERAGVRTVTTLNTGLGDDTVIVDLDEVEADGGDGFFVLNMQGPYNHSISLATDVSAGDHRTPADEVRVFLDGVELDASRFSVDTVTDTLGLMIDLAPFARPDLRVEIRKPGAAAAIAKTFTLPRHDAGSDQDTVDASGSTRPLVIFGGQDDDTITGGAAGDIIFGERGRVLYFDASEPVPVLAGEGVDFAALAVLEAHAVAVFGHGGPADKTDGVARLLSLAITLEPAVGGADTIVAGMGNDMIFGGIDDDTIDAGQGDNIVLGDSGFVDTALLDGVPSDIDRIWSTDPDAGGSDHITTGGGHDIVIGGEDGERVLDDTTGVPQADTERGDGDTILAGDGHNIVFGDNGRITSAATGLPQLGGLPITLGRVETIESLIGGSDWIITGKDNDIVLGGIDADTIHAGDGDNIVLGDSGYIDWTAKERGGLLAGDDFDASDIDRILSIDPSHGGNDTITTGSGDDIIIGGEDGELVDDVAIAGTVTEARSLVADAADGDTIVAGGGRNLVLGDAGEIYASAQNAPRFGALPITLGLVTSTATLVGGSDSITTGDGDDIVIGGIDADTILAGHGHNIVIGDSGLVDWAARERGGLLAGDDFNASDIDRIWTLDPDHGGNDSITTGADDDIIIGGEDGELVVGIEIAGSGAPEVLVLTPLNDGDTIVAGNGHNIVLGDNGEISAAAANAPQFSDQPITLGLVTSMATTQGGNDSITTGIGRDIIVGGVANDTIVANFNQTATLLDGDNIVFGDNGFIDYTALERPYVPVLPGDDANPADIDRISTFASTHGGIDTIVSGAGYDLIFGGTAGDTIYAGAGNDLVFGDHGKAEATLGGGVVARNLPLSTLADSFTFTSIDVLDIHLGGPDTIYGEGGEDIIIGGQGGDAIYAGTEDDDVIGGHTVAGGWDGGETIDGGTGNDVIVGDNGIVLRRGDDVSRIMRTLPGAIYDAQDNPLVDTTHRHNPDGVEGRDIAILDHSFAIEADFTHLWGDDYIAGGAGDDVIFGQLGDDAIQGDGSTALTVGASRDETTNALVLAPSAGNRLTDGDDYVEGGGGNDVIFGGLGQDDLIGGSSDLFGLGERELRPDGEDFIFGGDGSEALLRNGYGDTAIDGHAQDADAITGDNATIYRLVVPSGMTFAYRTFTYDDYTNGAALEDRGKVIPRAVELLDYTPGGPDFAATTPELLGDNGAADEIHGESGDDVIYGMTGNDVLFGEGQDDDLIGGWGHDWISGGTGDDGVLGDDGRIYTSRNGTPEPLYGLAAEDERVIDTPGNHNIATIFPVDLLNKTVNLTPFNVDGNLAGQDLHYDPDYADDIIFGGLGNDFLHGGAGDDAVSGAEALADAWVWLFPNDGMTHMPEEGGFVNVGYDTPGNPGHALGFEAMRADEFAAYEEFTPMVRIVFASGEFFLNFDVEPDGDDMIFGDLGNDWLVGGTDRDWMFGGFGSDLMNADDDHTSNGGANDIPDGPNATYEDYAFGGGGRDVMIANTGGDRLIDWAGEFNSYLVPFSPFGMSTVSRMLSPALQQFLYDLSYGAGADRTRAADTGADPARNGEPEGELGLVNQRDPFWQEQTGAPDDPQPGNTNGPKDVLRRADFNSGSMQGFSADSGIWQVQGGSLYTQSVSTTGDAVTIYHVGEQLPSYYELQATINAVKPTGGWKANSYVIFDYHSPTDFKFAGINVSLDKIQLGHRDATGWHVDVQASNVKLKPDVYYNMLVAVNGLVVTVTVDNQQSFSHAFAPRIIDGVPSNLNWGYVGFGSEMARGRLDNIQVKVLERPFTLITNEDYDDGVADLFTGAHAGDWQGVGGRYEGVAGGVDPAYALIDLGLPRGIEANARTELSVSLATGATAGFVFDLYPTGEYKFVLLDVAADMVLIGHHSPSGWTVDASAAFVLEPTSDHRLLISLAGSTVSVMVDDKAVVGHAFNAVTVDGAFGTMVRGGAASFDDFSLKTSDSRFEEAAAQMLVAPQAGDGQVASEALLTQAALDAIVAAAIERWSAALGTDVSAALQGVVFAVGELDGAGLAQTVGRIVVIDESAAGHGWFIDPTPLLDEEFAGASNDGEAQAKSSSAAVGRIDLLTVVMHEIGHLLGFTHDDAAAGAVMEDTLATGVRRLPEAGVALEEGIGGGTTEAQSGAAASPSEPAGGAEDSADASTGASAGASTAAGDDDDDAAPNTGTNATAESSDSGFDGSGTGGTTQPPASEDSTGDAAGAGSEQEGTAPAATGDAGSEDEPAAPSEPVEEPAPAAPGSPGNGRGRKG
jgi:Ca2+-binding RTX toxin-like protein